MGRNYLITIVIIASNLNLIEKTLITYRNKFYNITIQEKRKPYLLWLSHRSGTVQIGQVIHSADGHGGRVMIPVPRRGWRGKKGLLVG